MFNQETLLTLTEAYLKSQLALASGAPDTDFDSCAPFGELGVDSFRVLKMIKALEADFGTLPKTLLFENFNIDSLARYFVDKHQAVLTAKFAKQAPSTGAPAAQPAAVRPAATAPAAPQASSQPPAPRALQPLRMLERDLPRHPELDAQIQALYEAHKNEGCVSRGTRNIAPNLFIGSERRGYFNYARSNKALLVYAYTGPADYFAAAAEELRRYCAEKDFVLNILSDEPIGSIGDVPFTATPFGALQRILNIQKFKLEGGDMRRLRYQVSKFEKAGACSTREYRCGTDKAVDENIAAIIDQWCETKTMVNPLIHIVRQEILDGTLHPQHRIFLTSLDDKLQNVILVSQMSRELNGYLMDLEFYPRSMPLGGLEYAIVNIVQTLKAEGYDMLSLGGTYGVRLHPGERPDADVDRILDDLHSQGIFNDESNLQFKNKFRPENRAIYLCRPEGCGHADQVIDLIMMIADPAKAQTPDTENHNAEAVLRQEVASAPEPAFEPASQAVAQGTPAAAARAEAAAVQAPAGAALVIQGLARSAVLAGAGFNPLNVAAPDIDFDLKTDSWAQLETPFVSRQMQHLRSQLQQPADLQAGLKAVFPFAHFVLTDAGRSADHVFCKAWPRKGVVLQNLLFPSCIYHQIDKGFTPVEVPAPAALQPESEDGFKGNLCLDSLRRELDRRAADIAYVCVEVCDNAAGGQPVSLRHLREVKELLSRHGVPLVLDATRILDNARLLLEREAELAGKTLWEAARAILSCADAAIGSLAKNFCVNTGGFIATNDEALLRRCQEVIRQDGGGLGVIEKKLVAHSLHNPRHLEAQVQRRVQAVHTIWQALQAQGVPVARPAGGHCVLIDVKRLPALAGFKDPVGSFLAWLYLNTGVRAGAHSVGMQRGTALNGLVRLAIPVGLKQEQAEDIAARLVRLFSEPANIPEVEPQGGAGEPLADVHARHLLVRYHHAVAAVVEAAQGTAVAASAAAPASAAASAPASAPTTAVALPQPTVASASAARYAVAAAATPRELPAPAPEARLGGDIAVVGMAGRFPKARTLDEFWDNLRQGRDCLEELPVERLAQRPANAHTRRYRGGFIDGVDRFDSLFFNISPREAEVLDPQERLFLEVAWETLEDAGYHPELLSRDGAPRKVGVFVGAVWAMYQIAGVEAKLGGSDVNANSFLWSVANRVSFWMNLTGPSLTVDTACSSSLTALHLACEAIRNGECTSALVGGVNLDLHQHKFDINWAGGALSRDGVCRTFGAGANGYVAGEGVVALYLKPLEHALADRDQVYGVIKGAVVNHGGRTSGYTVPSPKAQGEVIAAALRKAGVEPRSIGYIEAHGTGTELGDPIEIAGLNNAFDGQGLALQSCPIGSVKTNIGHLEAAAGVAGVCKVLLQMKYGQLVPSLHSAQPNEHIDFERSFFRVQQQLQPWERQQSGGAALPLRAGVSSFGAGGANAHVVLESHDGATAALPPSAGLRFFPLSARTEEQLREMASRLRAHLQRDFVRDSLSDIEFTLRNGRKSFEHRVAVVAGSREELVDKLALFVEGRAHADVVCGRAGNGEGLTRLLSRAEKEQFIALLAQSRDPHKLAQLWADGLMPDGGETWPGEGRRVSLPVYPFADKRHWIRGGHAVGAMLPAQAAASALHPMIDSNESTFQRQLFRKRFHAHEFFLGDHVVSGIPTLPGTAYLDLARKAGELSTGRKVRKIRNVTWISPLTAQGDAPTEAFIELKPAADAVSFEVFSDGGDGRRKVHAQGRLVLSALNEPAPEAEYLDLAAIRARCARTVSGAQAYPAFVSAGLAYGQSFQLLQEVHCGDAEVLGLLQLPRVRQGDFAAFELHPCLLDAAMQAGVAAQMASASAEMRVPYAIGEVELLHPLTPTCYSYLSKAASAQGGGLSKENVTLLDEHGRVLARMRESVGVPLASVHEKPAASTAAQDERVQALYYTHQWRPAPLGDAQADVHSLLVFDRDERLLEACARRGIACVLVQPGEAFEDLGQGRFRIRPGQRQDYTLLLQALQRQERPFAKVCFAWPRDGEPADAPALADALEQGVYAFLYLCQALVEQKLKGRTQMLYLHAGTAHGAPAHDEAINGFVRSLRLEHPKMDAKVVEVRQPQADADVVLALAVAELHESLQSDITVRHEAGARLVRTLTRLEPASLDQPRAPGVALRHKGVYLVTGGAGGLGLIFAEYLARQCGARLVLTGRSQPGEATQARLRALQQLGAEVLYVAADVSTAQGVQAVLGQARARFGALHGIVHSAGVLRDSYLKNKTAEELRAVCAPKVAGTFLLDEHTRGDDLDFFVLFSSLAGIGGNAGQCDYAFANHYLDAFAARREALRAAGQRKGKAISLNWSLWGEGGMKLDAQTELFFKKNLGIWPLRTEVGLQAFARALQAPQPHLAVLEGEREKIELAWGLVKKAEAPAATVPGPASAGAGAGAGAPDLAGVVMAALSGLTMELLRLGEDDFSADSILLDLGFDSMGLAQFANAINDRYGLEINPVLFFEHPTVRAVAAVLASEHTAAVQRVHGQSPKAAGAAAAAVAPAPAAAALPVAGASEFADKFAAARALDAGAGAAPAVALSRQSRFADEPIAIVGMAGVLPQSDNLQEYWEHLREGRNLVTEIPRERWVWEDYDGDPVKQRNKSYSRWGGFMKEVDKFDPLFFGITPREAEMMDPQQRIFIETVWSAIENAGQKVSDLAGTRTGVFVGVSAKDYIDVLAAQASSLDGYSASGNSHSILANRVSFLLNLRGPSAPLDTACSSSLIALHRAIESIHTGSCDMAIVGGVQVMLTPVGHVSLSSAGMLSPDGRCKTFDKDADGYVRGEGAGAIFIKPLARALADGNPVHAVVKATAENHGGRVTMLTAPNPKAQAELLFEAYDKAGVDPARVGYIECHGTGTSLGDPIEIQALKKAFADLYAHAGKAAPQAPHCGLSSVKTNIGHLEPAAGIASLLKVLLSLKHRQIPALLHFSELNPYIELRGSPFYIVDKTADWPAPVAADGGAALPRVAGVSSFGWGGANAHVVLEEYVPPARPAPAQAAPLVVPLSARTPERLQAYAAALLQHVRGQAAELADPGVLADLAYTLQVGRDAMDERLALVVDGAQALESALAAFAGGHEGGAGLYRARVARNRRDAAPLAAGASAAELAQAWVQGTDVDWKLLHGSAPRRRLSLPTYPFARERYWIQAAPGAPALAAQPAGAAAQAGLLLAAPVWEKLPASAATLRPAPGLRQVVLLCGLSGVALQRLRQRLPGVEINELPLADGEDAAQRYAAAALACFQQVQALLRDKGPALLQVVAGHGAQGGRNALLAGLAGLFKSARMEAPQFAGQVLLAGEAPTEQALAAQLRVCAAQPQEALFKALGQGLGVQRWQPQDGAGATAGAAEGAAPALAFRDGGVYLITGGLGGLGLIFAKEILRRAAGATVLLTGRAAPGDAQEQALSRLRAELRVAPQRLAYRQLDLQRLEDVQALVADVTARHGGLHGVIHSAGMTRDAFLANKAAADIQAVLAPKVAGTVHLDAATRELALDFLVLFSSATAALGNVGQADYAAANGFMDQFAAWRNALAAQGQRRGRALSINWPLWDEGGMQIDARARAALLKATGLQPLRTAAGLQAFHRSLALGVDQALVLEGQLPRLRALLPQPGGAAAGVPAPAPAQLEQLRALLLAELRQFQPEGVEHV